MRTPSGRTKMQRRRMGMDMSISELSERTGVDTRMLQKYETRATNSSGQVISPIESVRLEMLIKIATALECKVSDIIEDEAVQHLVADYENRLAGIGYDQDAIIPEKTAKELAEFDKIKAQMEAYKSKNPALLKAAIFSLLQGE